MKNSKKVVAYWQVVVAVMVLLQHTHTHTHTDCHTDNKSVTPNWPFSCRPNGRHSIQRDISACLLDRPPLIGPLGRRHRSKRDHFKLLREHHSLNWVSYVLCLCVCVCVCADDTVCTFSKRIRRAPLKVTRHDAAWQWCPADQTAPCRYRSDGQFESIVHLIFSTSPISIRDSAWLDSHTRFALCVCAIQSNPHPSAFQARLTDWPAGYLAKSLLKESGLAANRPRCVEEGGDH